MEEVDRVEENTHSFSLDPNINFFMQAGGCFELHEFGNCDDEQDIVHIHADNIDQFLDEFKEFVTQRRLV
jgi:hypothetical protein